MVIDKLLPKTNNLNSEKVGVIYFYFNYQDPKSQSAEDVVACLLKQLIYQSASLPENLESAYDRWVSSGTLKPNLDTLVELLADCGESFDRVFILCDALDECLEAERLKLISRFQRFTECGFKLFVTTRPHLVDIDEGLLRELEITPSEMLAISADKGDVEKYLNEELEKEDELREDPDLKTDIIKKISAGVDGQYILNYRY